MFDPNDSTILRAVADWFAVYGKGHKDEPIFQDAQAALRRIAAKIEATS